MQRLLQRRIHSEYLPVPLSQSVNRPEFLNKKFNTIYELLSLVGKSVRLSDGNILCVLEGVRVLKPNGEWRDIHRIILKDKSGSLRELGHVSYGGPSEGVVDFGATYNLLSATHGIRIGWLIGLKIQSYCMRPREITAFFDYNDDYVKTDASLEWEYKEIIGQIFAEMKGSELNENIGPNHFAAGPVPVSELSLMPGFGTGH